MRRFITSQLVLYGGIAACAIALAQRGDWTLIIYFCIAMLCWMLHAAAAAGVFALLVRASLNDRAAWRGSPRTMGVVVAAGTVTSAAVALAIAGPTAADAAWACAASVGWTIFVLRVCRRRDYAGLCANCRYDLRGTLSSRVCPECGTPLMPVPAHTAKPEEDYRTPNAPPA